MQRTSSNFETFQWQQDFETTPFIKNLASSIARKIQTEFEKAFQDLYQESFSFKRKMIIEIPFQIRVSHAAKELLRFAKGDGLSDFRAFLKLFKNQVNDCKVAREVESSMAIIGQRVANELKENFMKISPSKPSMSFRLKWLQTSFRNTDYKNNFIRVKLWPTKNENVNASKKNTFIEWDQEFNRNYKKFSVLLINEIANEILNRFGDELEYFYVKTFSFQITDPQVAARILQLDPEMKLAPFQQWLTKFSKVKEKKYIKNSKFDPHFASSMSMVADYVGKELKKRILNERPNWTYHYQNDNAQLSISLGIPFSKLRTAEKIAQISTIILMFTGMAFACGAIFRKHEIIAISLPLAIASFACLSLTLPHHRTSKKEIQSPLENIKKNEVYHGLPDSDDDSSDSDWDSD